jgi:hypothetical protein
MSPATAASSLPGRPSSGSSTSLSATCCPQLGRILPPQRWDPQFGVEIGAAGVHDLLRGTNPSPHDRSHDHLSSRSDAPAGSAARGNPCRVGRGSVSDRGGWRKKAIWIPILRACRVRARARGRCCRAGGGGGPRPGPAMRRRNLKMIITRHGASGRCWWRLTANITAVVSR